MSFSKMSAGPGGSGIRGVPIRQQGFNAILRESSASSAGSGSIFADIPRWQLALLIGIPTCIFAAGFGYWFWRRRPSSDARKFFKPADKSSIFGIKSNANDKGGSSADTQGNKSNVSIDGATSGVSIDENKPLHIKLKDSGNDKFKSGCYPEAMEFYEKALKEVPAGDSDGISTLHHNKAATFEKFGDFQAVIKECNLALKFQPTYIKALVRRAKALKSTGFVDEALQDITAVCILERFSQSSNIAIADELLKIIGTREAEKIIKERQPYLPSKNKIDAFFRSFTNDPLAKIWAGEEPEKEENETTTTNGEEAHDEEQEDKSNKNSGYGYLTAVKLLQEKKYDDIIDLCQNDVNDVNSKYHLEACNLSGTLRFLCGYNKDTTVEVFKKIIESSKASNELKVTALIKIGCYFALTEEEDPLQYFQKAEAISSNNGDIFHHRGQVLLTKGLIEEACVEIEKAADLCPNFALAVATKWFIKYRIAGLTDNIQDAQEADRNYVKLLRKFPKSPDVFNLYAQIQLEKQQLDEANIYFDKVLELDPNNTNIVVHKAMVAYYKSNDVDQVIQILEESLKHDDKNEFVHETLGSLELQKGNLDKAVTALDTSLKYAKSYQEIMMLSSLRAAAQVQIQVRDQMGIEFPTDGMNFGGLSNFK